MNILQISESIYPLRMGGIENHVYHLSSELAKLDNDVTVLIKKPSKIPESNSLNNSIQLVNFQSPLHLYKYIISSNFDVIHYHNLGPQPIGFFSNEVIQILAKIKSIKVVNTPHGALDVLSNPISSVSHSRNAMKVYLWFLSHFSMKLIDMMIAVNPFQVDNMSDLGLSKSKISLVTNGVPSNVYNPADGSSFVDKYNLQDQKILLYVGRLTSRKRVSDLIYALKGVISVQENVMLVILGPDGGIMDDLTSLTKTLNVESHVVFVGEVDESEKMCALNAADIFVNPSEYEAFGITALEAMAQGTPVISANNDGARFLLEEGKNGLLYEIGNKEELKSSILSLLNDDRKINYFINQGLYAATNYKWEHIAKKINDIYSQLIK